MILRGMQVLLQHNRPSPRYEQTYEVGLIVLIDYVLYLRDITFEYLKVPPDNRKADLVVGLSRLAGDYQPP